MGADAHGAGAQRDRGPRRRRGRRGCAAGDGAESHGDNGDHLRQVTRLADEALRIADDDIRRFARALRIGDEL
jgi:hypothetical protein